MTYRRVFIHLQYSNRFYGKKRRVGKYGTQDLFTLSTRKTRSWEKHRYWLTEDRVRGLILSKKRMNMRCSINMPLLVDKNSACPLLCAGFPKKFELPV